MKTILDNGNFVEAYSKRCAEQHIDRFFLKILAKKDSFGKIVIDVDGDCGDEIFDATYSALKDVGLDVSTYDVITMETPKDKYGKFANAVKVTFKEFDYETYKNSEKKIKKSYLVVCETEVKSSVGWRLCGNLLQVISKYDNLEDAVNFCKAYDNITKYSIIERYEVK